MSATESVPVRVVYDSAQRRRRGPVAYVTRRSATTFIFILGLLNLGVAASLYYAIWWRVDPFIYMTFMLKTPILTEDMKIQLVVPDGGGGFRGVTMTGEEAIASIFGVQLENPNPEAEKAVSAILGRKEQTPPDGAQTPEPDREPAPSTMRWSNSTSQKVIPIAAYGWLTLATVACCAVGLVAGAGVGTGSGARGGTRIVGVFLSLFFLGGLTYGGYVVFTQYTTGYPVEYVRYGMGGLALLAAALGLAISPHSRGLRRAIRFASYCLILSAIASVLGVYLWRQAGAIEPQYATPAMLALIFAAHSAWGWLLLIFSFRI